MFDGRDITNLSRAELRRLRREMQMIFQDPFASLNPRMRVGEIVTEPLVIHSLVSGRAERDRKAAGGERVERTGMTTAFCAEQPLHDADCVR